MRLPAVVALFVAACAAASAQETRVPTSRPQVGGVSAYRYAADPAVCPPCDNWATIPPAETRRILCDMVESPLMGNKLEECVDYALAGTSGLNKENVFATLIDLCPDNGGAPHFGHYNGNVMQVPAEVSRLFWATALEWKLQQRGQRLSKQLDKDMYAMLNQNNVAATNKLVDFITATESGDELGPREMCGFARKRDFANMFFGCCLGFENFNVNQKVWTGTPSPRDLQLLGAKLPLNYESSNRVTTNHTAALLMLLDREAIVSKAACCTIKNDIYRPVEQAKIGDLPGIAAGLPVGSKMWSVNGYTVHNYNDAAIVHLPNGKRYVLAIFSSYDRYPTMFLPKLSEIIANRTMTSTGDNDGVGDYLYIPKLTGK